MVPPLKIVPHSDVGGIVMQVLHIGHPSWSISISVLLAYTLLLILKKRIEKESPEKKPSISDVCRWVKDRCLVSLCMWILDKLDVGLRLRTMIGMIRPQIYT